MPHRDNFYSEEVQAILGKAPSWVVRWGMTVVFAIFAGILIGSYFIKYPDTVEAPAVITTLNPPADLYARYDGLIDTLCVEDGQLVEKGTSVAFLRNAADWHDVQRVAGYLTSITSSMNYEELVPVQWIDGTYRLGELQSAFADFQSKCRDYRHYLTTDHISKKKQLLAQQIVKNKEYYSKLEQQRTLLSKDLTYGRRTLERDSLLLIESVISPADYEITAQNYIAKENSMAGFDATLTSTELQIIQNEQQIVELTLQQENERAEYERALRQSQQQLTAQIAQWRQQYVLEAPSSGRVTLMSYWSKNQHIAVGNKLASIVPDGETEVIGRMQIPSAGFGKVKVGQAVIVKLNGFPYMEFGVLRGSIRSLSAVPEQVQTQNGTAAVYMAEVAFPNGMTTSYNKELPMIQQMDGTAEIVTEDMRLIQRFIQPVVSLFKNR
jgi:biotin carboxyl carrier protein